MIRDCERGKIDLVITKSVSRFCRNTLDGLNYVRRLKRHGVGVYFEKENVNTLFMDNEMIPPGDLDAERSQTGRLAVSEPAGTWQEDLQAISYSG